MSRLPGSGGVQPTPETGDPQMADVSPLRRRMIEDMTVRNLSPATQRSYVHAVAKFSRFFGRSPDRLDLEDVRSFQVHLVAGGMSWPALNQTVCALRFLYGVTLRRADLPERIVHAREPQKLPVVLSTEEVVRFLEAVPGLKCRAALTTAYAAGLRASEVASLKVADIDSSRMVIRVELGKGGRDRYVMLSPQLLGILRAYWRLARPPHWLFPRQDGEHPIHPATLNAACRSACAAGVHRTVRLDGTTPSDDRDLLALAAGNSANHTTPIASEARGSVQSGFCDVAHAALATAASVTSRTQPLPPPASLSLTEASGESTIQHPGWHGGQPGW